jgi:hypothetical protein
MGIFPLLTGNFPEGSSVWLTFCHSVYSLSKLPLNLRPVGHHPQSGQPTGRRPVQCTRSSILTLKNCRSTSVLSVVIHKAVNLQVGDLYTKLYTNSQKLPLNLRPVGRHPHMVVNLQVGGPCTLSSTQSQKLPLNLRPVGRHPQGGQPTGRRPVHEALYLLSKTAAQPPSCRSSSTHGGRPSGRKLSAPSSYLVSVIPVPLPSCRLSSTRRSTYR